MAYSQLPQSGRQHIATPVPCSRVFESAVFTGLRLCSSMSRCTSGLCFVQWTPSLRHPWILILTSPISSVDRSTLAADSLRLWHYTLHCPSLPTIRSVCRSLSVNWNAPDWWELPAAILSQPYAARCYSCRSWRVAHARRWAVDEVIKQSADSFSAI